MILKRFLDFIREAISPKPVGTYVAYRYHTDENATALLDKMRELGVPNLIKAEDLHTTIIYSRKQLVDFEPYGELVNGTSIALRGAKFYKFGDALVIIPSNTRRTHPLWHRHHQIMEEHPEATYDFEEYVPHITVSYDAGDFPLPAPLKGGKLVIKEEYMEDLDLDKKFDSTE